jgi:transposase
MRRTEALLGARMIKVLDILGRYEGAEFSQVEAAELLGVGERTFRRWRQRFEDADKAGLLDRRPGQGFGQAGSG